MEKAGDPCFEEVIRISVSNLPFEKPIQDKHWIEELVKYALEEKQKNGIKFTDCQKTDTETIYLDEKCNVTIHTTLEQKGTGYLIELHELTKEPVVVCNISIYQLAEGEQTKRVLRRSYVSEPSVYTKSKEAGIFRVLRDSEDIRVEILSLMKSGWGNLEDLLNNAPLGEGEPVLLYHNVGAEDDYMLLFTLPSEPSFFVDSEKSGETSGDYIDNYSLSLVTPGMRGFRINHYSDDTVSEPREIMAERAKSLHLSNGVLDGDDIVTAFGVEEIKYLIDNSPLDKEMCFRFHMPAYHTNMLRMLDIMQRE